MVEGIAKGTAEEVGKVLVKGGVEGLINKLRSLRAHTDEVPSHFIRDVLCYNQGKILEFWWYLLNYYTAVLRLEALAPRNAPSCRISDEKNFEEVKIILSDLKKYRKDLLIILNDVYKRNLKYIRRYYEIRDKYATDENGELFSPRVTIKVFIDKQNEKIDYLLRDLVPKTRVLSRPFQIDENSAIEEVFKNKGFRVIINNIPKYHGFKNPRIDENSFARYSLNSFEKLKIICHRRKKRIYVDDRWRNCWKDKFEAPVNSFYKSTMIIPITLINNDIGKEFREFLGIDIVSNSSEELVRAIYGFLCFDSIYTDFFDKTDEDIGYFFADIFSFYLVPLQMVGVDLYNIN